MPGQVALDGTLSAKPTTANAVPGATIQMPLAFTPANKPFTPTSGAQAISIEVAAGFVDLFDANASPVKNGNLLVLRSTARVDLRITQKASSGTTVKTLEGVKGLAVLELEDDRSLQMVEASGTATIEWWVSGNT